MIDGTEVPVCSARSSWIFSVESLWDGEGFFCGGRLGTGPRSMDILFDQPARVFLGSGRIGGAAWWAGAVKAGGVTGWLRVLHPVVAGHFRMGADLVSVRGCC